MTAASESLLRLLPEDRAGTSHWISEIEALRPVLGVSTVQLDEEAYVDRSDFAQLLVVGEGGNKTCGPKRRE